MASSELSVSDRSGLLSIPSLPADLPPVDLTDNARQVLVRRYVRLLATEVTAAAVRSAVL